MSVCVCVKWLRVLPVIEKKDWRKKAGSQFTPDLAYERES